MTGGTDPMTGGTDRTEPKGEPGPSLEQRILDIAVYAPVGLAAAVGESLPRLIADGRRRLGPGVATAQVVGRFAAGAGYGLLCRRLEGLRRLGAREPEVVETPSPSGEAPEGRGGDVATRGDVAVAPVRRARAGGGGPGGEPTAGRPTGAATGQAGARASRSSAGRPEKPGRGADPGSVPTPAVDALAIPGFASLSASQVVQRLDGLTESELRDLRAFEAGTRHRRTILNRVDQLLGT
jgi:hypothetical protein